MSNKDMKYVRTKLDSLNKSTKKIGGILPDPFMTLSFLALPVIPALKITDKGLFDVTTFSFIEL